MNLARIISIAALLMPEMSEQDIREHAEEVEREADSTPVPVCWDYVRKDEES